MENALGNEKIVMQILLQELGTHILQNPRPQELFLKRTHSTSKNENKDPSFPTGILIEKTALCGPVPSCHSCLITSASAQR